MARKFGAATIAVEVGPGKLHARDLKRALKYWARNCLMAMLGRKANLTAITMLAVRGAYSTMIGNLAFEAPDACASAMELARRGIAARAKLKDVFLGLDEGWCDGLRKISHCPAEVEGWAEVHRAIKAAKLDVRRPHPRMTPGFPGSGRPGLAVRRLGRQRRGGLNHTSTRLTRTDARQFGDLR